MTMNSTISMPPWPQKLSSQEAGWIYQTYGAEQAREAATLPVSMVWELYTDVLALGPMCEQIMELVQKLAYVLATSSGKDNADLLLRLTCYDEGWWDRIFTDWHCRARAKQLATSLVPLRDREAAIESIGILICMLAAYRVSNHRGDFNFYCKPYLMIHVEVLNSVGISLPELFPEIDWS